MFILKVARNKDSLEGLSVQLVVVGAHEVVDNELKLRDILNPRHVVHRDSHGNFRESLERNVDGDSLPLFGLFVLTVDGDENATVLTLNNLAVLNLFRLFRERGTRSDHLVLITDAVILLVIANLPVLKL